MVPLRVIEEIDAKKYGDSKRLRSVARGLLSWIDGLFGAGYPGPVSSGVVTLTQSSCSWPSVRGIGRATRTRRC